MRLVMTPNVPDYEARSTYMNLFEPAAYSTVCDKVRASSPQLLRDRKGTLCGRLDRAPRESIAEPYDPRIILRVGRFLSHPLL
jgi:hypothetical protein